MTYLSHRGLGSGFDRLLGIPVYRLYTSRTVAGLSGPFPVVMVVGHAYSSIASCAGRRTLHTG